MSKFVLAVGFVCAVFVGCGDEDDEGTDYDGNGKVESACIEQGNLILKGSVATCNGRTDCLYCTCASQNKQMNAAKDGCEARSACTADDESQAQACFDDTSKNCSQEAQAIGVLAVGINCPATP